MVLWRISPRWFGGTDVNLPGFKLFCRFIKTKKSSRKGWFCGEYRPDGSGEPMLIYQVLSFSAVSLKQKNHPVKDGFVENIAPMVRGNRC